MSVCRRHTDVTSSAAVMFYCSPVLLVQLTTKLLQLVLTVVFRFRLCRLANKVVSSLSSDLFSRANVSMYVQCKTNEQKLNYIRPCSADGNRQGDDFLNLSCNFVLWDTKELHPGVT